ncbi:hypothetical protein D9615_004576 [Tricholomella constricta]|uniref:Asparaginase n=1 Tax=Tricholomella constricta TaxID=117010 RepID=A0A8H5M437_9AGAR|nr:hypothetical protein D9615_004576 [Tricholomella constricta]
MSRHAAYIAVHGGAGMHSHAREKEVKQALRLACKAALKDPTTPKVEADDSNHIPLDMVGDAIAILEDDPHLNAGKSRLPARGFPHTEMRRLSQIEGYGSNLSLHGTVECDAAIMDGLSGGFGSVGAVSGVKNPIRLACAILEYSKVPDPLGRIPPLTLVSEGARAFAAANDAHRTIETVPADSLVSPKAKDDWMKWRTRLERGVPIDQTDLASLADVQDTVGAVACQNADAVAAGVSRVLGSVLFGGTNKNGLQYIRCVVSDEKNVFQNPMHFLDEGAGEHITRAMLARTIAESFQFAIAKTEDVDVHDILYHVLLEKFLAPCQKRGVIDPEVGVLLLTSEETGDKTNGGYFVARDQASQAHDVEVRLWCAFTTSSMAIAYASSVNPNPKAQILRRTKTMDSRGTSEPLAVLGVPLPIVALCGRPPSRAAFAPLVAEIRPGAGVAAGRAWGVLDADREGAQLAADNIGRAAFSRWRVFIGNLVL